MRRCLIHMKSEKCELMRYFLAKRYKNIKHLTRIVKNMEKEEILFTASKSINQFKNQQKNMKLTH